MNFRKKSDLFPLITGLKTQIVFLVVITFCYAGAAIFYTYLVKILYDRVYAVFDRELLWKVLLLILGIFALMTMFNGFRRVVVTSVRFHLLEKIRLQLLGEIAGYEYQYFVQTDSNLFMSRLAEDCDIVTEGMVTVINAVFNVLVIIVWLLFFLFFLRWVSFVYLSLGVIVIGWVFIWRSKLRKTSCDIGQHYSGLYNFIWTVISGMRMIKLEMLQGAMIGTLGKKEESLEKSFRTDSLYSNILWAILDPVTWAAFIFILFFGIKELQAGNLTVGMLTFCIMFIWKFSEPVIEFNEILTNMHKAGAAMRRIADFAGGKTEQGGSVEFNGVESSIEFRNVGLSYAESGFRLKNISFSIAKGESVAIIGKSGSGKSSIANILVKLITVSSGKVLLDNVSLDNFTLESLRDNIVIVPQKTTLYPVSLRKNINIKNHLSEKELSEILNKLGLKRLIDGLPEGIDSQVIENGAGLSGGEKQRISLARALSLKATTYVFDEVTANIDPATEKRVLDTIFGLGKDVTKLFITHNLGIVSRMDRVFLVNEKGIRELGNDEKRMETEKIAELYA